MKPVTSPGDAAVPGSPTASRLESPGHIWRPTAPEAGPPVNDCPVGYCRCRKHAVGDVTQEHHPKNHNHHTKNCHKQAEHLLYGTSLQAMLLSVPCSLGHLAS